MVDKKSSERFFMIKTVAQICHWFDFLGDLRSENWGVQRIPVCAGFHADKHPRISPLTAGFESISRAASLKTWT